MDAKTSLLPPVAHGIFSLPPYDDAPPTLLGGYCQDCKRYFFPRPKYCPDCLNIPQERALGSTGTLYSYTTIRIKAPLGFPSPYSVVYVDLDRNGLRVFGLFDPQAGDQLKIGLKVKLEVGPLGNDLKGQPCLRPYFRPLNSN